MPQKHPAPQAGRKQSELICWNTHEPRPRAERQAGHATPHIINTTNNVLTGEHLICSLSPSSAQGRRRMLKPESRSGSPEQFKCSSVHMWQGSSYVKSCLNQSSKDVRSGEGQHKATPQLRWLREIHRGKRWRRAAGELLCHLLSPGWEMYRAILR